MTGDSRVIVDPEATERARLAALREYHILDTAPEEAYDRIIRLAHSLFGLPIALISLIDDKRQWFKARFGLEATETPRSWAFCNHAITQSAPLVVTDATTDPRFRDNPLVVGEPRIRFYAGAQIRDPEGLALGTVCVISPTPNIAFSPADEERLASLAGIVANEMELRRQLRRAIRHNEEKDLLIREVHYQVADSLQFVTDILDLQAHAADDPDARLLLQNAALRVIAVGEVHKQLRQRGSGKPIDVADYLNRLAKRVWRGLARDNTEEPVDLSVSAELALPPELLSRIGMAITALVTNAIRRDAVRLHIGVTQDAGWILLGVTYDDGKPVRTGYDLEAPGTGIRLIRMLAGGDNVTRDPTDPACVMVRFRHRA